LNCGVGALWGVQIIFGELRQLQPDSGKAIFELARNVDFDVVKQPGRVMGVRH
jgi:hypothetical protein